MTSSNKHISDFLDYYYKLKDSPEYAILLKGAWGSGKTWFIKQSLEKLNKKEIKFIKVSLYGITNTDQIESAFFSKLHPLLESKAIKFGGSVLKRLFKNKIPNINVLDYISSDDVILIFDDLERCSMPVNDVLGYINQYVEEKGFKAIIIANEDEIIKKENNKVINENDSYLKIKEKLIGKTFEITPDIQGALTAFINNIDNSDVQKFYTDERNLIENIYNFSGYENLRHLKQILWDFERFYDVLSEKVKSESQLLKDLLKLYLMYSFELKKGKISADDLYNCMSTSSWFYMRTGDKTEELKVIFKKYPDGTSHDSILSGELWIDIMDKGLLDEERINKSLSESKYLLKTDSPLWMKLWDYRSLNDETFKEYVGKVEDLFDDKKIENIGEIKHLIGELLTFAEFGFYEKTKQDILKFANDYIDHLEVSKKLPEEIEGEYRNESYKQHQYIGLKIVEFIEFSQYVDRKINNKLSTSYENKSKELMKLLDTDIEKFSEQLDPHTGGIYYNIPILSYIKPEKFVEKLVSLNPSKLEEVKNIFKERFSYPLNFEDFERELKWLKSIKKLLDIERKKKNGELSGYLIENFVKYSLKKSIDNLESRKPKTAKK